MRQQGFTLIELLVVVAIVGILSAVTMPSYQEHVNNARRSQAKSALMSFAAAMERHYAESGNYEMQSDGTTKISVDDIFYSTLPEGGSTADQYYTLSIVDDNTDAESYQLRASATGMMAGDGDFLLTSTGIKSWGSYSCWEKNC